MSGFSYGSTNNQSRHPGGQASPATLEVIRQLKVLIIDDEADTREIVGFALSQAGAKVQTTDSAAEVIAALKVFQPDVLISDIGMPQIDGYALIRMVRALPADEGGKVPAIALTAYARAEDRTRVLAQGFQVHLPKPVEPRDLLETVAHVVPPRANTSES